VVVREESSKAVAWFQGDSGRMMQEGRFVVILSLWGSTGLPEWQRVDIRDTGARGAGQVGFLVDIGVIDMAMLNERCRYGLQYFAPHYRE